MKNDCVSVRMYNVGFGDCFLLKFPGTDRPHTMLVDCGVHSASQSEFALEEVVAAVLDDVTNDGGIPRLDVVVATHRHQDHVKGFEDKRWSDLEVGEVWMPWTENPDDPDARSLLRRQSGAALQLLQLAAEGSPAHSVAVNSLTNERAMAMLHTGFAGQPLHRFLPSRDESQDDSGADLRFFPVLHTDALPGVAIHVLGPSHDERIIRKMDPPDPERYVALPDADLARSGDALPFGRWRIDQRVYRDVDAYRHLNRWGLGDVVKAGRDDSYLLAVALEQAVNNTSLMLLIQLGDAWLLFPGDAQWGSWDRILRSSEGRELVSRTTFYKVGHHGSHNATPRTFVEDLLRDARAVVSVAKTGIPSWKNIPKVELLAALVSEGRCQFVVNSSDLSAAPPEVAVEAQGLIAEVEVPI